MKSARGFKWLTMLAMRLWISSPAGAARRLGVAMRNKIPFDARFWNFLRLLRLNHALVPVAGGPISMRACSKLRSEVAQPRT